MIFSLVCLLESINVTDDTQVTVGLHKAFIPSESMSTTLYNHLTVHHTIHQWNHSFITLHLTKDMALMRLHKWIKPWFIYITFDQRHGFDEAPQMDQTLVYLHYRLGSEAAFTLTLTH